MKNIHPLNFTRTPLAPEEVERLSMKSTREDMASINARRTGEHKDLVELEDFYHYYASKFPIRVVLRSPDAR